LEGIQKKTIFADVILTSNLNIAKIMKKDQLKELLKKLRREEDEADQNHDEQSYGKWRSMADDLEENMDEFTSDEYESEEDVMADLKENYSEMKGWEKWRDELDEQDGNA